MMHTPFTKHSEIDTYHVKDNGNSLLEISMALSMMALLMFAGFPTFKNILIQQERIVVLYRLKNAIEFSKNEAFMRGKIISLCASQDQVSCSMSEDWASGFIAFENPERKKQVGTHCPLLEIFPGAHYGRIYFSATGNQLHIHPNGTTTNIGTFIYTPKSDTIKPAGLVVNWAVRTYSTTP